MFEPVFPLSSPLPTSHALRVSSCKIDQFRSKDIYRVTSWTPRQQDWMRTLLLFIPLSTGHWCFFFTFHGTSTILDLVHRSPIYTHSLSFQFPIFLHAYLLAPLYQRLINPHSPLLVIVPFSLPICTLHPFPGPTTSSNIQSTCASSCLRIRRSFFDSYLWSLSRFIFYPSMCFHFRELKGQREEVDVWQRNDWRMCRMNE